MSYLARLKEIENKKISDISPVSEVPKVPKAPFDTFDTCLSEKNRKISVLTVTESKEIEIVRAWLFKIGEPEEDHYLVWDKCRNDPEAMAYFLRHVRGEFESNYRI
jgi:hypothetical protein